MAVTESVFVNVGLHVFGADRMESTVDGVNEIFKFRYKANKNENNVALEDDKKRIEFLEIMTLLLGGENKAEVYGEKNG